MKPKSIITIHGSGEMGRSGRAKIARWLRKQADALESDGDQYSGTFRARYFDSNQADSSR